MEYDPLRLRYLAKYSSAISWQSFDKVLSYIQVNDVCLVPHHGNAHTDSTIPHKLFQYMLIGKPVIVNGCHPLKRIVEEIQAGFVFRSRSAQDSADKIIALYRDGALREALGRRGHDARL